MHVILDAADYYRWALDGIENTAKNAMNLLAQSGILKEGHAAFGRVNGMHNDPS